MAGADPHATTGWGLNAVYYAIGYGHPAALRALLRAGADPNRRFTGDHPALRDLSFATIRTGRVMVASRLVERQNRRVLEMIVVLVRALALACRGHHELVLEHLALRQHLNA